MANDPGRDPALTRNAADVQQVRRAGRKVEERDVVFRRSLVAVMGTPEGRLVIWKLLGMSGLDETVFNHSGSIMCFNEGRRNFGLELKAHVIDASEALYLEMEREQRERQRQEERGNAASRQARAEGEERA